MNGRGPTLDRSPPPVHAPVARCSRSTVGPDDVKVTHPVRVKEPFFFLLRRQPLKSHTRLDPLEYRVKFARRVAGERADTRQVEACGG